MFPGAQQGLKAKTLNIGDDVYALDFPNMRWAELFIDNKTECHVGQVQNIDVEIQLAWKGLRQNALDAKAPRYYLLNNEEFLTIVIWVPSEGVKVAEKFKYTHSVAQVKQIFDGEWKEFRPEGEEELTHKSWHEATREMTDKERYDAMTFEEKQLLDVKKLEEQARQMAPKLLPGMSTMGIRMKPELLDECKTGLSKGEALCMCIVGESDLDLFCPKQNIGRDIVSLKKDLPDDQPGYVLYRADDGQYDLIVWAPDDAPPKMKMKVSTLRAGLHSEIKKWEIHATVVECHDEADIKDFQVNGRRETPDRAPGGGQPERKLPIGVPPGAMALPGIGMMKK